jgi:release factor glutamine methyltransferase
MRSHPDVYDPSDDTMLLANNLSAKKNDVVLEIGVGSGYVSLVAAQIARIVVGTDVNPYAIKLAKLNAKLNSISNVEFILGDLFSPIEGRFDLILMNPPYLQEVEGIEHRYIDLSWNGGQNGRMITDRFLQEVENYLKTTGRILMVQSSHSDYNKTIKVLSGKGFSVKTIAEKRLFFETLYLIEATKTPIKPT